MMLSWLQVCLANVFFLPHGSVKNTNDHTQLYGTRWLDLAHRYVWQPAALQ